MDCASEMLDAAPPMMWHIRRAMREQRRGLSMPQFRAMVMISNEPSSVSLSCVADHLALSLPTTSRIVSGLVEKGLLKRQGSATDRRQMSLEITGKGKEVLDKAWAAAQQSMAAELKRFTPQEWTALASSMRMLKQMFGSLGRDKVSTEA
jgi:DNA-binding MarR family transcriptional regulator